MNSKETYIDLHTHTTLSDGSLTTMQLLQEAKKNNIGVIAITDHDRMLPEKKFNLIKKLVSPELTLIRGAEVRCAYPLEERIVELHVVALFPEEFGKLDAFYKILEKNTAYDRRPYIEALLKKLAEIGIHLGTYEDLQAMYPQDAYIGRPQVAKALAELGYASSCEAAMDELIGDFGKRRAWVENKEKGKCASLDEVLDGIMKSRGLAVLAHPYFYSLTIGELEGLLKKFSRKTGKAGGMETEYRRYEETQRRELRKLAGKYDLFYSAGSDYHGIYESDGLDNQFSMRLYEKMMERWEICYRNRFRKAVIEKKPLYLIQEVHYGEQK